jgi:hypothetical protein
MIHCESYHFCYDDLLDANCLPSFFDNSVTLHCIDMLIDILPGILRLSTKYNILQLRRKVIAIYLEHFPSTLDTFDSRSSSDIALYPWYTVTLVALFRETNALECLPCVFYICSCLPMCDLLDGCDDVTLSWEDKSACLKGREELLRAQEAFSYSFIFKLVPPPNCANRSVCARRARRNLYHFHHDQSPLSGVFALEPFTDWKMLDGICPACISKAQMDHQAGRKAIWNRLPKIFGLGTWEDIEKVQQNWADNHSEQGN